MILSPSVAGAVQQFCNVERLTQADVAKRLGISPQYLCDIVKRRRELPDTRILACRGLLRGHLIEARIAEYEQRIAELRKHRSGQ